MCNWSQPSVLRPKGIQAPFEECTLQKQRFDVDVLKTRTGARIIGLTVGASLSTNNSAIHMHYPSIESDERSCLRDSSYGKTCSNGGSERRCSSPRERTTNWHRLPNELFWEVAKWMCFKHLSVLRGKCNEDLLNLGGAFCIYLWQSLQKKIHQYLQVQKEMDPVRAAKIALTVDYLYIMNKLDGQQQNHAYAQCDDQAAKVNLYKLAVRQKIIALLNPQQPVDLRHLEVMALLFGYINGGFRAGVEAAGNPGLPLLLNNMLKDAKLAAAQTIDVVPFMHTNFVTMRNSLSNKYNHFVDQNEMVQKLEAVVNNSPEWVLLGLYTETERMIALIADRIEGLPMDLANN